MVLALGIWVWLKGLFNNVLVWALGMGGPGLFVIAVADSSFLSIPEGNDILIVVKSAGQSWPLMSYFVLMTVLGSTLGCSLLYSVGRWGGGRLQRRLNGPRMEEMRRLYDRRGVWTIVIPAILPPPTPFKMFVLSAGVFRLPFSRFIMAVLLGRSIRYFIWGVLAVLYGLAVRNFIVANARMLGTGLLVLAALVGLTMFLRSRQQRRRLAGENGVARSVTAILLVLTTWTGLGCAIKTTKVIPIPEAHLQAREASLDDLVDLVNLRYADFQNLVMSKMEVEFTGSAAEGGMIEEDRYRRADGILIAERPDRLYLNIKNPLGGASLASMSSNQGRFQVYLPRERKYYTGANNVVLDNQEKDVRLSIRPHHLVEALLIESLPVARDGYLTVLRQDEDERFKYYVVSVIRFETGERRGELLRELWFERSRMELVRQQYYQRGEVTADIRYDQPVEMEGKLVPTLIEINRPMQQYSMKFEVDPAGIQLNRPLKDGVFEIVRPPTAELIELDDVPERLPQASGRESGGETGRGIQ